MYVKPFEFNLWLSLGCFLSAIAIFIYIYNRKQKLSPSFSPFFFFVSTLFEEPYSVPTALWNDSKFKTITIAWLLTAIIFTNVYTGLMISELTVPLKGAILHTLEDVFGAYAKVDALIRMSNEENVLLWDHYNLHFFDPKNSAFMDLCRVKIDYSKHDIYLRQFRETDHFALLQAPKICDTPYSVPVNETQRLGNPYMYNFFSQFLFDVFDIQYTLKTFNPIHVLKFSSLKHRHYPRDPDFPNSKNGLIRHYMAAAVEKEIVACGKSIFIADLNELRAELLYLNRNYPDRLFYVGKGSIEDGSLRKVFWDYRFYGNPITAQYLRYLLQAGIRTHILRIQSHKKYLERRIGTIIIKEMQPTAGGMDMNGSIQTIFIILVAILSLASFVFSFECIHWRRKLIYLLFEYLFVFLAVKIHYRFTWLINFKIIVQINYIFLHLFKYLKTCHRFKKTFSRGQPFRE
jgi:hypothetical protein